MEQLNGSHIVKGLFISAIIIAMNIINYFRDNNTSWAQYFIYAVFTAGVIISCRLYGKQLYDNVTFGNTFAHGFKTSSVVTIISIIFVAIFPVFFPEAKEKAIKAISDQMLLDPANTPDKIKETMEQYGQRFTVLAMGATLFRFIFMGLLASLIGAAVTKKNPDSTHQRQV